MNKVWFEYSNKAFFTLENTFTLKRNYEKQIYIIQHIMDFILNNNIKWLIYVFKNKRKEIDFSIYRK